MSAVPAITKSVNVIFIQPTDLHRHIVHVVGTKFEAAPGKFSKRALAKIPEMLRPYINETIYNAYHAQRNRPYETTTSSADAVYIRGGFDEVDTIIATTGFPASSWCCSSPVSERHLNTRALHALETANALAVAHNFGKTVELTILNPESVAISGGDASALVQHVTQPEAKLDTLPDSDFTRDSFTERLKAIKADLIAYQARYGANRLVADVLSRLDTINTKEAFALESLKDGSTLKLAINHAFADAELRKNGYQKSTSKGLKDVKGHACSERFFHMARLKDLLLQAEATLQPNASARTGLPFAGVLAAAGGMQMKNSDTRAVAGAAAGAGVPTSTESAFTPI